jgi:hypothetical protein
LAGPAVKGVYGDIELSEPWSERAGTSEGADHVFNAWPTVVLD